MNKILCAVILFTAVANNSYAQPKSAAKPATKAKPIASVTLNPMKNLNDSFSYAAGLNIARSMQMQGVTTINGNLVQKAIDDVLHNKTLLLTDEQASMTLQEQLQAYSEKQSRVAIEAGRTYCEENKKKSGVTTLPDGLQYEVLTPGDPTGIKPKAEDNVKVHYVGTTIDGKEFDSSIKRGEPATFPLNRVITGWTEILQLMTKGAKWRVVIPSELAYGERGSGAVPPNATLIFEIELLDILPAS